MSSIYFVALIVLPMIVAVISPVGFVYVSLLTGPLPISFGMVAHFQDLGRMSPAAFHLLGLCLAAMVIMLMRPRRTGVSLNYCWPHLLFLFYCMIALIWAPSQAYGARMLAKLAAPALLFMSICCAVSDKRQLKRMEWTIIASGVVSLLIAVPTKLMGMGEHGGLSLPNTTPALFSAHIIAVGVLALSGITAGKNVRRIAFAGLCAIAVLMADTRNTIVGVFVAYSIVLFLTLRGLPRLALPAMGIMVVPFLFLFVRKFRARMFVGGERMDPDALLGNSSRMFGKIYGSGRFAAWGYVMEKFFYPNPVFGSGTGATQHMFYTHSTAGVGVIHSEYIRLLAEVGLFGMVLYLFAIAGYVLRLVRLLKADRALDSRRYAVTAVAGIAAYLIFMATDNAFDYVSSFGVYIFAFIAMALTAREFENREAGANP